VRLTVAPEAVSIAAAPEGTSEAAAEPAPDPLPSSNGSAPASATQAAAAAAEDGAKAQGGDGLRSLLKSLSGSFGMGGAPPSSNGAAASGPAAIEKVASLQPLPALTYPRLCLLKTVSHAWLSLGRLHLPARRP
jgi:hypothetical protein